MRVFSRLSGPSSFVMLLSTSAAARFRADRHDELKDIDPAALVVQLSLRLTSVQLFKRKKKEY